MTGEQRVATPGTALEAAPRAAAAPAAAAATGAAGRVVVIANLKGGTGKSTLVINLGGALAAAGRRVAVLDCDPQGTAAAWALRGGTAFPVRHEPLRNLNGAGGWLVTASEMRREVDVLLVDLPSVVAPAMGAAFMIASLILIPAAPRAVDVDGTRRVLGLLDKARAERPESPPVALLAPVRVRDLERGLTPWEAMLEPLGLPLAPPLRHRVEFDRAFEQGGWVGELFPGGEAHREAAALAERVLAELRGAATPPSLVRPRPVPQLAGPPRAFLLHDRPRRAWWRRLLGA